MPQLSRRTVLASGAGALVGSVAFAESVSAAVDQQATGTPVVVLLTLKGGMDGLAGVLPRQYGALHDARPALIPQEESLIPLNDDFAVDPAWAPLAELFHRKELSFVHAVGPQTKTNSHTLALQQLYTGSVQRPGTQQGWLARAVPSVDAWSAVSLGSGAHAAALQGARGLVQINSLEQLQIPAPPGVKSDVWLAAVAQLWRSDIRGSDMTEAMASLRQAVPVLQSVGNVAQPALLVTSALARELSDAATLIRSSLDVQAISIEHEGWDTHVNLAPQATAARPVQHQLSELAAALRNFWDTLGEHRNRVTLLTVTEFGRSVAQNSMDGTDHGDGSLMIVMGAGVQGGQVTGDWPGISGNDKSTLRATVDWRQVAAEVISTRWGQDPRLVFDGLHYRPMGLMQG